MSHNSANTKRLWVQPVVQTAGYLEREFQVPNVVRNLGIGNQLTKTPPMVHLEDVVAFLRFLRQTAPQLEAGAGLQGLGGLQLMEALRLTWDKVDLKRGWVEVSGEVKNSYRNRVIPVCGTLADILRRADQRRRIGKIQVVGHGPVVVSPTTGSSFAEGIDYWKTYSQRLKSAIQQWNPKLEWTSKDLRNCLPTFATLNGIQGDIWEQYIGHAPNTVTGRHYVPRIASVTRGERAALARQMELFGKLVVEPLECEIARKSYDGAVQAETVDFRQSPKSIEISG